MASKDNNKNDLKRRKYNAVISSDLNTKSETMKQVTCVVYKLNNIHTDSGAAVSVCLDSGEWC